MPAGRAHFEIQTRDPLIQYTAKVCIRALFSWRNQTICDTDGTKATPKRDIVFALDQYPHDMDQHKTFWHSTSIKLRPSAQFDASAWNFYLGDVLAYINYVGYFMLFRGKLTILGPINFCAENTYFYFHIFYYTEYMIE